MTCTGDYGQFKSTAAQTALQQYEGADPTTSAGQSTIASAISTLEQIMATQVPGCTAALRCRLERLQLPDYTG